MWAVPHLLQWGDPLRSSHGSTPLLIAAHVWLLWGKGFFVSCLMNIMKGDCLQKLMGFFSVCYTAYWMTCQSSYIRVFFSASKVFNSCFSPPIYYIFLVFLLLFLVCDVFFWSHHLWVYASFYVHTNIINFLQDSSQGIWFFLLVFFNNLICVVSFSLITSGYMQNFKFIEWYAKFLAV